MKTFISIFNSTNARLHMGFYSFALLGFLLSTAAQANGKIRFKTESDKFTDVASDIVKKIKSIDAMIEDLGGYSSFIDSSENLVPLPTVVSTLVFNNLVDILSYAKAKLKLDDLTKASETTLENIIEKKLALLDSASLVELIKLADYLDVQALINSGLKVWKQRFLMQKNNGFYDLPPELQKKIVALITPEEFLDLIQAHKSTPNLVQTGKEEEVFKIALRLHYDSEVSPNASAKGLYEQRYYLPLVEKIDKKVPFDLLMKIKPTDPAVISRLIGVLKERYTSKSKWAAKVLAAITPTTETIESALLWAANNADDLDTRLVAINALLESKPVEAQLALVKDLQYQKPFDLLMRIKPTDPIVISRLIEVLKERYTNKSKWAAKVLAAITPSTETIELALIWAANNADDLDTRLVAINALLESKPVEAQLALVKDLQYQKPFDLLMTIKPTDPIVISRLIEALKERNRSKSKSAAEVLAAITPTTETIESALLWAANNADDLDTRLVAINALLESKPVEVQLALVKDLQYQKPFDLLMTIKPTDPIVISRLIEALKERNKSKSKSAAEVLAAITPTTETIESALLWAANNADDLDTRLVAINALLESKPVEAQLALVKDLQYQKSFDLLMRITPTDPIVISSLVMTLKDNNYDTKRRGAAEVLAEIKPRIQIIVTALTEALNDRDQYIRNIAKKALAN